MPESDTSEADTSEAVENVPRSGVPDDLDLGGITINIWSPADTNIVSESYVSLAAEGLYLNLKDAPYSVVLDGDWTIDYMREISAEVFVDVDNDGIAGRADVLGYCINTLSNLDGFFYGSGASITSRDENRIPYIDMMTEHTAEALRDMNADYGIVPMPKLDKSQEDYITWLHNIMRDIALPSNCHDQTELRHRACLCLRSLLQQSRTASPHDDRQENVVDFLALRLRRTGRNRKAQHADRTVHRRISQNLPRVFIPRQYYFIAPAGRFHSSDAPRC